VSRGPSLHLSWAELACQDAARTPYPITWRTTRAVVLAQEFEAIRARVGAPITILSAYRTRQHNARIRGAAENSQHLDGRALDLATPAGWDRGEFLRVVLAVARRPDSQIRGVGEYPWGCHFDIRPGDRLARWSGSKAIQQVV